MGNKEEFIQRMADILGCEVNDVPQDPYDLYVWAARHKTYRGGSSLQIEACAADYFSEAYKELKKFKIALINCELEFDRLRQQSGMYYAEKGLKICNEALQKKESL